MADISKINVNNTEYNLKDSTVATQISNAINALDVSSVGGTGKVISAISETNGKISATVTTMDTVPTENSTNPVTSGGVYPVAVKAVDEGAKNKQIVGFTSKTYKGINITNKGDGTINLNGHNTAGTAGIGVADLSSNVGSTADGRMTIPEGDYVVSSGISSGVSGIQLQVYKSNGTNIVQIYAGNDVGRFTYNDSNAYPYIISRLSITASASFSNLVIKPMICTAPDWAVSKNFVPYALSNQVITPALIEQVDNAKNIAGMDKSSFTTLTKDSVTVTLSGDTITTSGTGGTSTNNFFNIFYKPNVLLIPAGTWVASLHGTGTGNFRIEEFDNVTGNALKGEFGEPLTFTIPENATLSYIRITSKPSTNCAGTFKLMICTASDWAVSQKFVPYCPTMQEMYQMILALQSGTT